MRIELKAAELRLAPDQTLKLIDEQGSTLCAVSGWLWITEENQASDIVVAPGECYRLRHPGIALVNSLGNGAAVRLA